MDSAENTDQNPAPFVVWVAYVGGGLAIFAVLALILRHFTRGRRYRGKERLDGKVVIITGCNAGIGRAHATDLARRGARVYMACRDFQRCEEARLDIVAKTGNKDVINASLDLGSLSSVRQFVQTFLAAEQRLDILVNNAGVLMQDRQTTADGFETQMGVNHYGPFLLTNLLLDVLRRSAPSRIVILSSSAHYFGRIRRDDMAAERDAYSKVGVYSNTKLANVLTMRALAQRLYGTGVTVNALHPGVVRTGMMWDVSWAMFLVAFFARTPEMGAQTQIRLSVDPKLATVTGKYFDDLREKRAAAEACDVELTEWLWRDAERATSLTA